jgi:D-alanine-D-alanine ligase
MNDHQKSPKKLRVGILFGGKSAEHEVSIQSAKNVLEALDKDKFEPVLIGINKQGEWHLHESSYLIENAKDHKIAESNDSDGAITLLSGGNQHELVSFSAGQLIAELDVIFPVLHGPMGEDGTVQGFLEIASIPYVGSGVLGSAIGMDKDVMKRLLRDAGVPITKFISLTAQNRDSVDLEKIIQELSLPLFVKPANMGSSVGVSKAADKEELRIAIDQAFKYDRKILIESAVEGDEIECAVLGNAHPKVSVPGRIIPGEDFYSYQAKYSDGNKSVLEIPANIPEAVAEKARQVALRAFKVLECEGLARVDMFATKNGEVIMNEVNTIPGFTKHSMYPRLWEASGLPYKDLITELITLAIQRFEDRKQLESDYSESAR